MGRFEDNLVRVLDAEVSSGGLRIPTVADIRKSDLATLVHAMYRQLGGQLEEVPLNLRRWDMELNGVAIELDEYLHFNRYRATTLRSAAYHQLSSFPIDLYRRYCVEYEERCLAAGGYGGKWTNSSCEKQYGRPESPKDLTGNGSPRWKQRAFYDFVKDLSPFLVGTMVVRIAIWDELPGVDSGRTVADALDRPSLGDREAILELLRSRLP